MLFFQKLARGNLRLWLEGNLPQNLRQMWREKNGWGSDPVLSSLLLHITLALVIGSLLMLVGLTIATMVGGETVRVRVLNAVTVSICVGVAGIFLSVIAIPTSSEFYRSVVSANRYLGLPFQELGGLSREELRRIAENNLSEAGTRLRDAELRLHSFHPEAMKFRTDFKTRFATFLALGMIEDVSYGRFIPTALPRK